MLLFSASLIAAFCIAAAAFTGCNEETAVDKAQNALESAQNAIGDAAETKASQMADAALGSLEIPENYGELNIPEE